MDTKLKKARANIKGLRGWFCLAALTANCWLYMSLMGGFYTPLTSLFGYGAFVLMVFAAIMLAVGLKPDSEDFHFFRLLECFKTDSMLLMTGLVLLMGCILFSWLMNISATWFWDGFYGISGWLFMVLLFVLMLPITVSWVLCYVVLVRRFKDGEKRGQLRIHERRSKKDKEAKAVREKKPGLIARFKMFCGRQAEGWQARFTGWMSAYERAYDYEKKQIIRTLLLVGANLLVIWGLLFTYGTRLWMLILLIGCIIFYLRQRTFYHDVGQIIGELHHLSEGEAVQPVSVNETSPLYEAACDLDRINESLDLSVKRQMKSEQMKVELITNVSHDLKTPLTSIIGYIDLLKKEEMSPEAQDYVSVISAKSEHLKEMIQDLFEISKATSGNAELVLEKLDMVKLLEQTLGDMEDRIDSSGRTIRTKLPEEPLFISGDGRKLYRVYQNLLENALKYSLEGTRIYVEAEQREQKVVTIVKNIAAYEMDFTPDKIVERFQRGDANRTTEGHGLGLAIAKSFSEACGGQLDIVIDGDMFKAIIEYPLYREI